MSSSPERPYNLRPRKNSPDKNPIDERSEISQSFPSSQSESSSTEDISTDDGEQHGKGQESRSLDKAADETDAGISCASDKNVTITDVSKDSHVHVDKTGVENKEISDSRENQNIATGKQSNSPHHMHKGESITTYQNECNSCLLQVCIIFVPVLLLALIWFCLGIGLPSSQQTNNQNITYVERPVAYRLGNLTTELEHIKAKYMTLDDVFWDVIAGSSWGHIQGDGTFKRPVVLLLVGQPKSNLDVVANDVARLYSHVFTMRDDGTIHIDGGWQAMKEADQAKLDMDNLLKNGFHNGRKVVLVTKFDKLPPCSIMLFHSYCDNDYAPHKDAVIIFTVELETAVSNYAAKGIEELVQEHLGALWAQCPEELLQDKIMAMHSRVSNNIAFVK